ncbi:hypothetical protein [uncultured Robinsoniella sp.]|uniref:hypothetical protein n=1 Tax=uncultured Robinsoniella sp. TaxID=904190 RepID=UPI00374F4DC9
MADIVTALTEQMTTIGTSITGILTSSLPIALPIIGGVLVITKGIGIFKKVTNKA